MLLLYSIATHGLMVHQCGLSFDVVGVVGCTSPLDIWTQIIGTNLTVDVIESLGC